MEANVNAPQPTGNKYAPTGWKKGKRNKPFDIYLEESDQTVLAKRLGIRDIVKAGLVAEFDTFTSQILPDGSQGSADPIAEAMRDEEKFDKLEATIDRVVMICVIAPKIYSVPPADHPRDENLVYVDEVEFDDKLQIFNECFTGLGNMSRFPAGQGGDLAAVETVSGASVGSESHGGIQAGDS